LQDIDFRHRQAELGFWLEALPGSEGLQVDVAQAALAFAFTTMELNSMRALITPGNLATAGILTALGMRQLQPTSKAGYVWTRFDDVHIWTITKRYWTEQLRS
jgi:RimJ/RimL family protein N-acetyltransferase